jgi:L-alanine-DL-glutamate epimerase-like enolase superfamily enzyme
MGSTVLWDEHQGSCERHGWMCVIPFDDIREYDALLKERCSLARQKLRDGLDATRLTLARARVSRVLIPMVGVYTPGLNALPACSWEFVELETKEGLVGTGEWPLQLAPEARRALGELDESPDKNLLDEGLEIPLFMAWWDLVAQVLGKPLHGLLAELFDIGFDPPDLVPLAAYSWNRFPDADGNGGVSFESWPAFARSLVDDGFGTVKVSMTAYEPADYVELLHRIREALPEEVDIRIDAHGSWNFREARRVLPRLEALNISYFEQPVNSLLPERFFPPGHPAASEGYQRDYYARKLEQLRYHTTIPFSDHWWTPPIHHPPGAHQMANLWEPEWDLIARYDPVDISVPDIGLGVFGLYRLLALARFMGLGIALHSNFELGLQSRFRGALYSALGYYPESAGLYLGTPPRLCYPMDTEYNQVRDDVLDGGKLAFVDGHIPLSSEPGHGCRLDPERVDQYRWTEERAQRYREFSQRLYENYRLDRPRRRTFSGWPKRQREERFDRQAYPYNLLSALGDERRQDTDVALNT